MHVGIGPWKGFSCWSKLYINLTYMYVHTPMYLIHIGVYESVYGGNKQHQKNDMIRRFHHSIQHFRQLLCFIWDNFMIKFLSFEWCVSAGGSILFAGPIFVLVRNTSLILSLFSFSFFQLAKLEMKGNKIGKLSWNKKRLLHSRKQERNPVFLWIHLLTHIINNDVESVLKRALSTLSDGAW